MEENNINITPEMISKLADILNNDGVISVPTDTVYGLCARINSKEAYEKLAMIKNRPNNKSFPVVCLNEEQIKNIAIVDAKAGNKSAVNKRPVVFIVYFLQISIVRQRIFMKRAVLI